MDSLFSVTHALWYELISKKLKKNCHKIYDSIYLEELRLSLMLRRYGYHDRHLQEFDQTDYLCKQCNDIHTQ